MTVRVYLDWNATAPLRPEARDAMIAALDMVGNPSSVHAEGRAATAVIERARAQVARSFGADGADIVFTSGATEAAALALAGRDLIGSDVEHDAVAAWLRPELPVDDQGRVAAQPGQVLQAANSETGVIQDVPSGLAVVDATQAWGKIPVAFSTLGADMALVSAHKLGGPKGIGALILKPGLATKAMLRGGGQEMGRRAGTQNVAAIAGFGAAAVAAQTDLEAGVWDQVEKLRKILENGIAAASRQTIFVGQQAARLPNTSCFATPGWKGETQVMRMDLAGFAISAGSACSSGKVGESRVLRAMGFAPEMARCAIRVTLGPTTTAEEIERFVDAWAGCFQSTQARVA